MNKNSTLAGKSIIILAILIILSYSSAKASDSLQLRQSQVNVACNVFNAVSINNSINLNWSLKASATNDHFEVERSFDQVNFSTAAFVLGAQSESNGIEQYSFKDKDKRISNHSVIYYRLKLVDVNGNPTYSSVKKVEKSNMK
ncbi:MAG TPA: hypothetical protein VIJ92_11320 [Ginsengibacter sp.]